MHVLMRIQAVLARGREEMEGGDWQGMRGSGVLGSIDKAFREKGEGARAAGERRGHLRSLSQCSLFLV